MHCDSEFARGGIEELDVALVRSSNRNGCVENLLETSLRIVTSPGTTDADLVESLHGAEVFGYTLFLFAAQAGQFYMRLHSSQQFACGKRFDQIIISARLQPFDSRLFTRSRRKQDHRHRTRTIVGAERLEQAKTCLLYTS